MGLGEAGCFEIIRGKQISVRNLGIDVDFDCFMPKSKQEEGEIWVVSW